MAVLAAIAIFAFGFLYTIDHYFTGGPASAGSAATARRYFFFDQDHITDAVSALGGMVAGVLGIVISVVSIVVQLSAERYAGVTSMFFRDRTNIAVMAFYVVACVCGVMVSVSIRVDFVPRVTLTAMMATVGIGLVMMAPYFAYVFRFLEPTNIVERIQREAVEVARKGSSTTDAERCGQAQAATLSAMEELTDVTSNSISGKDKIIASRAVDGLKDLALEYLRFKSKASPQWFEISDFIRQNPDFVAMEQESLRDLVDRKTWVEWKVMRQYLGIYNESLAAMKDINYLIAIDTRYIGEAAAEADDEQLVLLVLRFMNSYLRVTLNAKDVRTAYNVLNQYRLLLEALLRKGRHAAALSAVGYLKYYGLVSYELNLPFVTETIGYDVGALCQFAHELGLLQEEDALLGLFLQLDHPTSGPELGLKGVRKAQVKLGAYYLMTGEESKARRIYEDMADEPADRVRAIRLELELVDTKDFWEIIDRGRNFEFMPPPQKEAMKRFFTWFDEKGTAGALQAVAVK